jgi:hypothetical protein
LPMIIAPTVFDLRAHPDRNAERVARISVMSPENTFRRGVLRPVLRKDRSGGTGRTAPFFVLLRDTNE